MKSASKSQNEDNPSRLQSFGKATEANRLECNDFDLSMMIGKTVVRNASAERQQTVRGGRLRSDSVEDKKVLRVVSFG
ncbi:MAG: hypothetical protein WCI55_11180 [Armatimonadota bacterium]